MSSKALSMIGSALIVMLTAGSAQAEVLKMMSICPGPRLCPSFELALKPPKNWVADENGSKETGVQVMVPRGKTYHSADAVMYVKVSANQHQDVESFVKVSQDRWRQSVSDTKIERIADVERANGRPAFVSYRYENPSRPQQAFEAVSFGMEKDKDGNDFFVMVALTGKQKRAIDRAMEPYNAFLRAH